MKVDPGRNNFQSHLSIQMVWEILFYFLIFFKQHPETSRAVASFVISWIQVKAIPWLVGCLTFIKVFQMTLLKWDKPQEIYIALYFLITSDYAIFLTFISSEDPFRYYHLIHFFLLNLLQPDVVLHAYNSRTREADVGGS